MYLRELEHVSILDYEGRILREAVKYLSPKNLFEAGTNNGYATGWILAGIEESNESKGVFYSCDPRRFPDIRNFPERYRTDSYRPRNFLFVKESSLNFFARNYDKKFDFAFLDGDHRKQIVFEELYRLGVCRVGNNCIVFLHDVRPSLIVEEKQPFWGLMDYIEKNCDSKYNLFNLIFPGSLATNLDIGRIKKIMENSNLGFDIGIVPLGGALEWLGYQRESLQEI